MLQISPVAHHGVTTSCAETSCLSIQEPPLVSTVGQQHWSATLVSNVGHRWSRTVDETGVNTVPITTTGNEKTHFTVVLACSETGKKLKPLVIFKRKTLPKENVSNGVVVHCQSKGWVDRDGMAVWAEKVWRRRPVPFFNRTSLLLLDSFSVHLHKDVCGNLKKEHKTMTAVIPGGLTKVLQPLDISVNCSFKAKIREQWEKWRESTPIQRQEK